MTKLMQWLTLAMLLLSIWAGLITEYISLPLLPVAKDAILLMPIYLLMAFACYSLGVIGYRVATFNDCVDASEELKKQIEEAKTDLRSKGMKI